MIIHAGPLTELLTTILERAGAERERARICAAHLVSANLKGHDSHGVGMAPSYVRWIASGKLKPNARATVVSDNGAVLVIDGGFGLGQPVAREAMEMAIARAKELGVAVLDDLRANMSLEDIARNLADFGPAGPDGASRRLLAATGGQVDLSEAAHRLAAITWLRAWGCRHLRRADTPRTEEALRTWWATWNGLLPGAQATLTSLGEGDLASAGLAYDALRAAPAARRSVKGTDVDVAFGDTATAKLLFAIRPQVFPPWDDAGARRPTVRH